MKALWSRTDAARPTAGQAAHAAASARERDPPDPGAAPPKLRPRRSVSHEVISGSVQTLDICAVATAGLLVLVMYLVEITGPAENNYGRYVLAVVLAATILAVTLRKLGAYSVRRLPQLEWQLATVALVWAGTMSALAMVAFIDKVTSFYSRGWTISWVLVTFIEIGLIRVGVRALVRRWTREGRLSRTVAIVGAGKVGEQLVTKLQVQAEGQIVVAGIFDDRLSRVPAAIAGCRVLGTTDELVAFSRRSPIDEIIIALPLRAEERIGELVGKLRALPIDLRLSIDSIGSAIPMRSIGDTGSARMIEIVDRPLKHWSGVAKWIEDKILTILCLVAFAPVMALIAVAIRVDSRGSAFFRQERFGFNNEIVHVLKFRTMHVEEGDQSGGRRTVPNDPRVTRVGRILRSLSLDELPQLLNVLSGDMSLVGPRPHALAMKAGDRFYYDAVGDYFLRHRVRPGITGWAQVNGLRGEIDTVEKARQRVAYDLHYIDHWSLWLDLKILVMTLRAVLIRQNAY